MAGVVSRRKLLQMVAKFADTAPFCRYGDKKRCIGKTIFP